MSAEWTARPSQPIQPTSTNQNTLVASDPLTDAFHPKFQIPMNPFCAKNLKTNYNVMPYGDHGTERVKKHTYMIYLLDKIYLILRFECGIVSI
jgi:hypothetical protein